VSNADHPVAKYRIHGRTVYCSGLLGREGEDPETPVVTGFLPQVEVIFQNLDAILDELNLTVNDVVSAVVLVEDMTTYQAFNGVWRAKFAGNYPSRTFYAVKDLPRNADVEVTFTLGLPKGHPREN
jgi:2-iminobutanoate/2-iminopropanoate deaminase